MTKFLLLFSAIYGLYKLNIQMYIKRTLKNKSKERNNIFSFKKFRFKSFVFERNNLY